MPSIRLFHHSSLYTIVKGFNIFVGIFVLVSIIILCYRIGDHILSIADLRKRSYYNFYLFLASFIIVITYPFIYVALARIVGSMLIHETLFDFGALTMICFVTIHSMILFVLAIFLLLTSIMSTMRSYNIFRHLIKLKEKGEQIVLEQIDRNVERKQPPSLMERLSIGSRPSSILRKNVSHIKPKRLSDRTKPIDRRPQTIPKRIDTINLERRQRKSREKYRPKFFRSKSSKQKEAEKEADAVRNSTIVRYEIKPVLMQRYGYDYIVTPTIRAVYENDDSLTADESIHQSLGPKSSTTATFTFNSSSLNALDQSFRSLPITSTASTATTTGSTRKNDRHSTDSTLFLVEEDLNEN
ncbi:leucine-rich repeat serine/threonine-protein kinase 1 [Sarcoptes scabiei]|nr:leucine-rich repeat serine/threonine-protein kinase 1 [Sarcoptes scabiei]